MDTYKEFIHEKNESCEDVDERIKKHLKTIVSDDVYNKWIDHFVFEKIACDQEGHRHKADDKRPACFVH